MKKFNLLLVLLLSLGQAAVFGARYVGQEALEDVSPSDLGGIYRATRDGRKLYRCSSRTVSDRIGCEEIQVTQISDPAARSAVDLQLSELRREREQESPRSRDLYKNLTADGRYRAYPDGSRVFRCDGGERSCVQVDLAQIQVRDKDAAVVVERQLAALRDSRQASNATVLAALDPEREASCSLNAAQLRRERYAQSLSKVKQIIERNQGLVSDFDQVALEVSMADRLQPPVSVDRIDQDDRYPLLRKTLRRFFERALEHEKGRCSSQLRSSQGPEFLRDCRALTNELVRAAQVLNCWEAQRSQAAREFPHVVDTTIPETLGPAVERAIGEGLPQLNPSATPATP